MKRSEPCSREKTCDLRISNENNKRADKQAPFGVVAVVAVVVMVLLRLRMCWKMRCGTGTVEATRGFPTYFACVRMGALCLTFWQCGLGDTYCKTL